jgi:hypothetical protein
MVVVLVFMGPTRKTRPRAAKDSSARAYRPGDGEDRRHATIVGQFKTGARRAWARRIWAAVAERRGGSQDALAAWLFVGKARVSDGLNHGSLSLETLVVILAELRGDGWSLPDLPCLQELAQEGFIEAMAYLRDPKKRRRLSREDFVVLLTLLGDRDWSKAEAEREQAFSARDARGVERAELKLDRLAVTISATVTRRLGTNVERDRDQLRGLRQDWAKPWIECRDAVPFAWAGEL